MDENDGSDAEFKPTKHYEKIEAICARMMPS